jgi:hypothetical protein
MASTVKSCSLEKSLCYTKSKKCNKVVTYPVECDPIECCPTIPVIDPCACETSMDCCSLPYQRLDKLRSVYSALSSSALKNEEYETTIFPSGVGSSFNSIYTRGGTAVQVPNVILFAQNTSVPATDLVGFFPTYTSSNTNAVPVVDSINYSNAASAYNFVQTMRYNMYRDVVCTAADQVIGWFVNPTGRILQVFQDLNGPLYSLGLTYSDTLQYYDSLSFPSNKEKQKLASLNILFDISIDALRKINLNPKTEGNIMTLCDRCGQEWMIVINTADVVTNTSFRVGVNGYVIVACRI